MIEEILTSGQIKYVFSNNELLKLKNLAEIILKKDKTNYNKCLDPEIMMITRQMLSIEYLNSGYIIVPNEYEYYIRYLMSGKSNYYSIYYNLIKDLHTCINYESLPYLVRECELFKPFLHIFEDSKSYYITELNGFKMVNPQNIIDEEVCKKYYYKFDGHLPIFY